jgi:hypothetical protein
MDKERRRRVYWWITVFWMTILSCDASDSFVSGMEKMNCEGRGGTWRREVNANGEVEEWCENSPPPQKKETKDPDAAFPETCFLPPEFYSWTYVNYQDTSGSGGTSCHEDFVFTNSGAETVNLIVHTAWDNNAMKGDRWATFRVRPGDEWTGRAGRTDYADGAVTYNKVESILVVRDRPECAGLLMETSRPVWEARAAEIDELVCE